MVFNSRLIKRMQKSQMQRGLERLFSKGKNLYFLMLQMLQHGR